MDHAIVFVIGMTDAAKAKEFKRFFDDSVKTITETERLLGGTSFALYGPAGDGNDFVWVTRFHAEELDRVSRAAWPFVIVEIFGLLSAVRQRFDPDVAVMASSVLTPEELVDQWNDEYGRFKKLELGVSGQGPVRQE